MQVVIIMSVLAVLFFGYQCVMLIAESNQPVKKSVKRPTKRSTKSNVVRVVARPEKYKDFSDTEIDLEIKALRRQMQLRRIERARSIQKTHWVGLN